MPSCLAKIYMILLILSLRSVAVMMDKGRFCSFCSCNSLQTLLKWGLEVGGMVFAAVTSPDYNLACLCACFLNLFLISDSKG